ncbi:adenylate kinase family protein [Methanonatronarchaeum sp. AMET-Sl]|uniref:adenylate kinase family protein n=1 Tax=Methanonatronarchaeum sp. AMET-Sl TaxID=3037654 RepID=UPI00244E389A|nr:adenylate kinase family protein [Methanonatronarchaeum sp. AMET-Sl]WGI18030.1 adenylate kinase family protein [Methanonatronarchaeum sp. AMET-Sl]
MKIAITGTPGTGKTTATKKLPKKYNVTHLNQLVEENKLYTEKDRDRDSYIVDIEAIKQKTPDKGIVEGHFSHQLDIDRIILLRCHPTELRKRLKNKDFNQQKIQENVMAETVDVILLEAMQTGKTINEIETTNLKPKEVTKKIQEIIEKQPKQNTGNIDWIEQLNEQNDTQL